MDPYKIAEIISANTVIKTVMEDYVAVQYRMVDGIGLINDLADDCESANNSTQYHRWHGHLGQHDVCSNCHPFNRVKFLRIATGAKC